MKVVLILASLAFLHSCTLDNRVEDQPAKTDHSVQLNPNGDSELAKLMREMAVFMESTKERLLKNDSLLKFPDTFSQIHTAQRTPGMADENTMRLMGSTYLTSLQELYKAKPGDRKEHYSAAVHACITCHESVCPGPLKRIGTMQIP